jgi:hypothetical protein
MLKFLPLAAASFHTASEWHPDMYVVGARDQYPKLFLSLPWWSVDHKESRPKLRK